MSDITYSNGVAVDATITADSVEVTLGGIVSAGGSGNTLALSGSDSGPVAWDGVRRARKAQTDVDNHITDTADAHAASAITATVSATNAINDASTTVQAALGDIDTLLSGPGMAGMWSSALRRLRLAWATRASAGLDIYVIGDSISQGYYASDVTLRYVDLFKSRLEKANGQNTSPGYVPVGTTSGAAAYTGSLWTLSGSISGNNYGGFALRQNVLTDGSYVEITKTCDRITVVYPTFSIFSGSIKVYIDGVLETTLTAGGLSDAGSRTWDSSALVRGPHTLRLEASAASATLEGAFFYDGNYSTGVRVWNGGHFGLATNDWNTQPLQSWWYEGFDSLNPDCVIVNLGVNDLNLGVAASTFKTRLAGIVAKINANVPDTTKPPSIILVVPFATGTTSSAFDAYRLAIWQTALDNGCAVVDWTALAGYVGTGSGGDPYAITFDNIHPTDNGHKLLGNHLAQFVLSAVGEPEPFDPTQAVLNAAVFS